MEKNEHFMIHNAEDIDRLAAERGFLPFFYCGIPGGFSIEELTPRELWFSDVQDGPWEWKGPVIAMGSVAYGKFFRGKAGYVSLEWLPHLINYRRSRYQLADSSPEAELLELLRSHETLLTHEWKQLAGYTQPRRAPRSPLEKLLDEQTPHPRIANGATPRKAAFDGLVTRLQMSLRVVIADFEYNYTRQGERYGWGKARYTTPEFMYGEEIPLPSCSPEESLNAMVKHLMSVWPGIEETAWREFLR